MIPEEQLQEFARRLDDAAQNASTVTMLTAEYEAMSSRDAYLIQRALVAHRVERGAPLIGMKMGLTSLAKMAQMGVHEPIYGHLTSDMRLSADGTLDTSQHGHPRAEPEIAFILGRPLEGPTSAAEALEAVSGVCAAIEVIDSRYRDFKFTLRDVIADNASSARFVLGPILRAPQEIDLGNLGIVFEINGEVVGTGSSAAILEHPAKSLAALANMLTAHDERLEAGQVILAGSATAAVAVKPGDRVRALVDGLGEVAFSCS